MNYSDKIKALHEKFSTFDKYKSSVPVPKRMKFLIFHWTSVRGYLWVCDEGDSWNVSWGSGKNSSDWPVCGADFRKDNGERRVIKGFMDVGALSGAWESAVTVYPVRNETKAKKIFADIKLLIDEAYNWHIQ